MGKQMTYHMVDSIKGGTGKTTFSIMLAQYLYKKMNTDTVCLFDMDFIGTGMWNLFYTDRIGGHINNLDAFKKDTIFINQAIRHFKNNEKKYIKDITVGGSPFHIAFGSPEQKEKDKYICAASQNYTMALRYGSLKTGITQILKNTSIEEQLKSVNHVVLDMAPCNDNYSQVIKQVFFDRDSDLDGKLNYYLLLGMDRSHVVSAANYLKNMFDKKEDKLPDEIFVVFNDVHNYQQFADEDELISDSGSTQLFDMRMEKFIELLKFDGHISESCKRKIHFLVLNEFENYSKVMANMESLSNVDDPNLFLLSPFSYMSDYNNRNQFSFIDDTKERELWGLIQ